jgi:uncharacterized protein YneF (UPF0154 family)
VQNAIILNHCNLPQGIPELEYGLWKVANIVRIGGGNSKKNFFAALTAMLILLVGIGGIFYVSKKVKDRKARQVTQEQVNMFLAQVQQNPNPEFAPEQIAAFEKQVQQNPNPQFTEAELAAFDAQVRENPNPEFAKGVNFP